MTLKVYCSQCGQDRVIEITSRWADPNITLTKIIENAGWIVQPNYPYMDVYCSKRCAL